MNWKLVWRAKIWVTPSWAKLTTSPKANVSSVPMSYRVIVGAPVLATNTAFRSGLPTATARPPTSTPSVSEAPSNPSTESETRMNVVGPSAVKDWWAAAYRGAPEAPMPPAPFAAPAPFVAPLPFPSVPLEPDSPLLPQPSTSTIDRMETARHVGMRSLVDANACALTARSLSRGGRMNATAYAAWLLQMILKVNRNPDEDTPRKHDST